MESLNQVEFGCSLGVDIPFAPQLKQQIITKIYEKYQENTHLT